MPGHRNQSVKSSAKGVVTKMNPRVVLKRLTGRHIKSLQKTPEKVEEENNVKLEILGFEENDFSAIFECPFCDNKVFSRMELLSKHVTVFHKISRTNKKSADIAMILSLLNISVASPEFLNLDPTSVLSGR